ncbi:perlucin-like [Pecten maximus]|uniref:perlucin-like n=1 Tax=Pecten maximus TaxID=6579 RepID=UPI001458CD9A|nr:perlucin-like [Pecten maximus]
MTGFLLCCIFRYVSCLEGYWREAPLLRNYLLDSENVSTIVSSLFNCMTQCLMTDECYFISYIAVTSVCVRHRKWLEHQPQNSSSVWSRMVWQGSNISTPHTLGNDVGCPLGWHRFEASCFLFADVSMNWAESVTYCQKWDARLAEVDNEPKATFLREIAVSRSELVGLWLGGSDIVEEGTWVWTTSGSSISIYNDWRVGEPNGISRPGRHADCLSMPKYYGFLWDDYYCDGALVPVCEKLDQ